MGQPAAIEEEIGQFESLKGKTILIVDDEPDMVAMLKEMVEGLGMIVAGTAGDGAEALRLTGELDPGVILMDIRLSKEEDSETGIEVAEKILEKEIRPIVLISGFAISKYHRDAAKAKLFSYIIKPVSRETLATTMVLAIQQTLDNAEKVAVIEELKQQLADRKIIEKAKDYLMKRHGVDGDAAFAMLRKKSMEMSMPKSELSRLILQMKDVM